MTFDVTLPGTTMDAIAAGVADHPFYTGDAAKLQYASPATATVWAIEPVGGVPTVRLTSPQGSWYGHEAALEIAAMSNALGATPTANATTLTGTEDIRRAIWRAAADDTTPDDTRFFHAPRPYGSYWWVWQTSLAGHRVELGEQGYVPQLMWFGNLETRRVDLGLVWGEGQAQVFPACELVMTQDPDGGDLVIPYNDVMDALGDLVEPHAFADGMRANIVPRLKGPQCQQRWREAFGVGGASYPSVLQAGLRIVPPVLVLDDIDG